MVFRFRKSYILLALLFLLSVLSFPDEVKAVPTVGNESVEVPIIMYHQITRNESKVGKYIISQSQLEKDLDYITSLGYTTVTVEDLINFVKGNKSLPKKPIMLTFDDGQETVYTVLYPILKARNMCAVISVIGSLADLYTEIDDHNDSYSYLNWEEISLLAKTEEIEIQNHSYDMHNLDKGRRGIAQKKNESKEDYYKALNDDVGKMQLLLMRKAKTKATAMVYPYGSHSDLTLEVCKSLGFQCTLTCEERISQVTKYVPESLFELGRYNREGDIDSKEFFKRLFQ